MSFRVSSSSDEFQNTLQKVRFEIDVCRQSFHSLLNSFSSLEKNVLSNNISVESFDSDGRSLSRELVTTKSALKELPTAMIDRWKSERDHGPTYTELTVRTMVMQLKLHDRWAEIYAENEEEIKKSDRTSYRDNSRPAEEPLLELPQYSRTCSSNFLLHPFCVTRVGWDLIGVCFLLFDVLFLPIRIAWDLEASAGLFEQYIFIIGFIYWTVDILLAFNTAFMDNAGAVILKRTRVARQYLRGWFIFDLATVLIDLLLVVDHFRSAMFARSTRMLRLLRMARALRFFKVAKFSHMIEDLFTTRGQTVFILVLTLGKTLSFIVLLAHILACIWYAIGKAEESKGNANWLRLLDHRDGVVDEYAQSLAWTLGHLTANNVDADISTQQLSEHLFVLFVSLVSLVVLGCGIGTITDSVVAINKIKSETTRARSLLQRFFRNHEVPLSLRVRATRFVVLRVKQKSEKCMDAELHELLSLSLSAEFVAIQRCRYIIINPLFRHLQENYASFMVHLCQAFEPRIFAEHEYVFLQSATANALYITMGGTFQLTDILDHMQLKAIRLGSGGRLTNNQPIIFSEPTCVAEYGAYANTGHVCSLVTDTLGDAIELSGNNFANATREFPSCIRIIYQYAKEFLRLLQGSEHMTIALVPAGFTTEILRHLNNKKQTYEAAVRASVQYNGAMGDVERWQYLEEVYHRKVSVTEVMDKLEWLFPEVSERGVYFHLGEYKESNRCKCAILSIIYIHFNAYAEFSCAQSAGKRLSLEQWAEFQELYAWIAIDVEWFRATLVLLAIRGLGRIEAVRSVAANQFDTSAVIISRLMNDTPDLLPSARTMENELKGAILSLLDIYDSFNMAQFLQGENNPSEVAAFKRLLEHDDDQHYFRRCVLFFIGVMCSVRGTHVFHSSLFMDKDNSCLVLLGIRCLRSYIQESPQMLYWLFIKKRGQQFGLPLWTVEDYVVVRIACLIRAEHEDCSMLSAIWKSLADSDREHLTRHFLADGIKDETVRFSFLPDYLTNAKNNPHFGLFKALSLLVELLNNLDASGFRKVCGDNAHVNLQKVASFIVEVKSSRSIEFIGAHINFALGATGIVAIVSTKMHHKLAKQGAQYEAVEDKELAYALARLERRTIEQQRALSCVSQSLYGVETPVPAWNGKNHDKMATSDDRWLCRRVFHL